MQKKTIIITAAVIAAVGYGVNLWINRNIDGFRAAAMNNIKLHMLVLQAQINNPNVDALSRVAFMNAYLKAETASKKLADATNIKQVYMLLVGVEIEMKQLGF